MSKLNKTEQDHLNLLVSKFNDGDTTVIANIQWYIDACALTEEELNAIASELYDAKAFGRIQASLGYSLYR